MNRSNGVNSALGYDNAGRLTTISHDGPSGNLLFTNYTLDPNGNRTAITSSSGVENYTLDALNRLTNASYPNGDSAAYSYDANGNRLTQTFNGVTTNYSYDDAGQLLSDGTTSYAYDANGNLISAGADSYSWDWANRLTGAAVGGVSASYSYDAFDVRVSGTVSGTASSYVWDRLPDNPVLLDDGVHAYIHGGGPQAQIDDSGNRHDLLRDALGSIRGVADSSGALVGATAYDAFGAIRSQSGIRSDLGYTGELYTAATGLLHLRARDLNPTLGRFLSADTVRPNAPGSQGYNLYAYVANNPTTWVDPSGHSTIANTLAQLPRLSANGALLATSLAGLIKLTLAIGRNAASWAFGQHRNTSILVLGVMGFVLACGLIERCMASANTYGNLVNQAGSLATAGVLTWGLIQLQAAADRYPLHPTVAYPTTGGHALTQPISVSNGPLRPFWETCMLSAVVSGLADLTSSAFGYQNNATTNAGLAANAMYNVATCGGGGGSSGGSGGSGGNGSGAKVFEIVPYRPSSNALENHHGILDAWAKNNVPGYVSRARNNPTIALTSAQHNAANEVMYAWIGQRGGARYIDWTAVSSREIYELSEHMFDAAGVPQAARDAYYRAANQYFYTGDWKLP